MPFRCVGEKKMQAPLLGLAKSIYYFTIICEVINTKITPAERF